MEDIDGAETTDFTAYRTRPYSSDERRTHAVKRIRSDGFDLSALFNSWDTTAALEELGVSSLSAVEEILKTLLSSKCSREEIFSRLDGAVNGIGDSRIPEPCKPVFRPLDKLRQQLRDRPPIQLISSHLTESVTRQAPLSEKPKRKPRKGPLQPPAKRIRQGLGHSLRNDTKKPNVPHSRQPLESTSPLGGDHSEHPNSNDITIKASSILLTHTRTSRPLRERSSLQPRLESPVDDDTAANDSADSHMFPTSTVDLWRSRLEPCIADA